ncbi:SGNH/GDSL hydrolase family protein [Sphingobacterium faecium]|uniref:SGNH/GDSL hydrolase family protein n=1 Tax=Sphingobacterium faecium TaxID=34087 RepID=UPI00320A7C27
MSNILEPNFNGLPKPTDWKKVIVPLQQANEKEFRGATLPELANEMLKDKTINGQRMKAVAPGALPAGPSDKEMYMVLESPGRWTFGGTNFDNIEGQIMTLWWNKTTYSVDNRAVLPQSENKIPQYKTTQIYEEGKQFIKDQIIYEVKSGQTFNAGEVPETSTKLTKELGVVNSFAKKGQSDVMYNITPTHLTYFVKDEPIGADGIMDTISVAQNLTRELSAQIIICDKIIEAGQPDKMKIVGVYLKLFPAGTHTLDLKSLNIPVTKEQRFGLKALTSATPAPSVSLYKSEIRGDVDTFYFASADGVIGKESSNKVLNKLDYDFSYTVATANPVSDQFKLVDQKISNLKTYELIGADKFKNKIVWFFGTSITYYNGQQYSIAHSENPRICKGYQSYISQYLKCTVTNFGGSGNNLTQISATIKSKNYSSVDYVCIEGGVNDWAQGMAIGSLLPIGSAFNVNTSYGALQSAIEHIISQNSSCRIYLLGTIRGWIDELGAYPEIYMNMFKEIGKLYGIPVLDWYNECGFNDLNKLHFYKDIGSLSDRQIHLGDEGYKVMGELAVSFLANK